MKEKENRVDDNDETDDDGGEMADDADSNESERRVTMSVKRKKKKKKKKKKKMRMRLLIRAMKKTLVSLWKWELIRMKTKKMTYNLCLWLEQLHALDAWLDHDLI